MKLISDTSNITKNSYFQYENFFNLYQDSDQNYFYNLLRNINIFSANDQLLEDEYTILESDTWAYISYKQYGTIDLWWLVVCYNQIQNPVIMPVVGTKIILLKTRYVTDIINALKKQINP